MRRNLYKYYVAIAIALGLTIGVAAQGPYNAQLQLALRQFMATANSWTGIQTFNNITISGTCTGCGNGDLTAKYIIQTTDVVLPNAQVLASLVTGILKSSTNTGILSIAVAGDFPTLNQTTTGSAATLTTPRAIYGNNFDGSAALTQIIASTYGGTGNGFAKFSGPASTEKTFTLPNATSTILTSNAAVTVAQGGTGLATLTLNNVILGNGTSNPLFVAPGSSGNVLTSNGTTWASSAAASGGCALIYTAKSALYTAVANDLVGVTAGSFTVTLPAAASNGGKCIGVVNNGTGTTTVGHTGSDTIALGSTDTLNPGATAAIQGDSGFYWSDGIINWIKM